MKHKKPIDFCKICTKRTFDKKTGLVCSLTNRKPDFKDECVHFNQEPQKETVTKPVNKIIKVPNWKLPLITCVPPPIEKLGKKNVLHADEEKLEIKYSGTGIFLWFGILCTLIYLGCFMEGDLGLFLWMSPFGITGIFLLTLYFTVPKKKWVFDRKAQTVFVPGKYYVKGHTMKIDEMRIERRDSGSANTGITRSFPVVFVPMKGPDKWFGLNWVRLETIGGSIEFDETWSYISWYMDYNRPLPPGTVFDHCREREFSARKKQGFPLPIYYSTVATPEANAIFQTERNKVWKDETFCPDINKYGEGDLDPLNFKIPEGSLFYYPKHNPENWDRKAIKDPAHFKYAPDLSFLRYVFEDGKIVYVRNVLGDYLIPEENSKYTIEYFRNSFIDIEKYYNKKRYANFTK